jgi:hypothetical protein
LNPPLLHTARHDTRRPVTVRPSGKYNFVLDVKVRFRFFLTHGQLPNLSAAAGAIDRPQGPQPTCTLAINDRSRPGAHANSFPFPTLSGTLNYGAINKNKVKIRPRTRVRHRRPTRRRRRRPFTRFAGPCAAATCPASSRPGEKTHPVGAALRRDRTPLPHHWTLPRRRRVAPPPRAANAHPGRQAGEGPGPSSFYGHTGFLKRN